MLSSGLVGFLIVAYAFRHSPEKKVQLCLEGAFKGGLYFVVNAEKFLYSLLRKHLRGRKK